MTAAVALLAGYLLGSVPFGLLLTRMAGLGDIRAVGSGNIGATNVLRTGRKDIAAATLLLDGGKGAVAVLLMAAWGGLLPALLAGVAAVIGHCTSPWVGFKGGKGVATALGVVLAWSWPAGLLCLLVWLAAAFGSKRSSVGSLSLHGRGALPALGLRRAGSGGRRRDRRRRLVLPPPRQHRPAARRHGAAHRPAGGERPHRSPPPDPDGRGRADHLSTTAGALSEP